MDKAREERLLAKITRDASGLFGYNPLKIVTCPHCGSRLQAIDAKKHVRNS